MFQKARATLRALAVWSSIAGCGCASTGNRDDASEPQAVGRRDPGSAARTADWHGASGFSVLRVNNDVISVDDVLEPLLPSLSGKVAGLAPQSRRRVVSRECQQEVLRLVQDTLLYQEATKELSGPMAGAVDRVVDQQIRDRVTREFDGRQARFEAHLAGQGRSLDDAREEVRRRVLIVQYLQENILPRIADPTRRELMDYYRANAEQYSRPGRRELLLIDIPKDRDPSRALAQIREAESRLRRGEDFGAVAQALSQGIHAADGGSWGYIQSPLQGRYARASEALFAQRQGQVSGIIETADAYFIVKSGRVEHASTVSFSEVQKDLVERYRNGQFEIYRSRLLKELLDKSAIEPDENEFLRAVVASALQRLEQGA